MNMVVVWVVVGLILMGAEIFTGGFGVLAFGLAAFIAAGLAALGTGLAGQVLAVALGGLAFFALTRPLTRRLHKRHTATNARALVGQVGVVSQPIGGPGDPGYIRLGGEEWRATAAMPLGPGAPVVVRNIVGATLQVEAVDSPRTKEEALR